MTYSKERFETYIDISEMLEKYFDYELTFSKCQACPGFAGTWTCPGFDFEPKDFWQQYSRLHLIVDQVSNAGASNVSEAQDRLFKEKRLYDAEMLAREADLAGSTALSAQECVLCKKCARLVGKPCVHPDKMRYALESLGIIASRLVPDKLGFPILWSDGTSIPEYYLLIGGILEK